MASGPHDGGRGPPGPQDRVVDGGDGIPEDSTALLEEIKEIGEGIDLETEFKPELVTNPQRYDRAHGKEGTTDQGSLSQHDRNAPLTRLETQGIGGGGKPRQGQLAGSMLAPEQPQGCELKASSLTGPERSSREEVSEIVEIGPWPRPTSKAAAVLGSKTHPVSGLDDKEPPDRGPKSNGSRGATPRTIGHHDSDEEEPQDPGPSNKTPRAAAPPKRGLDFDEEPWDPGPSSKDPRAAALKTAGLEGVHDLGQNARSAGRAFRKANTSNEDPRDRGSKSKKCRASARKTASLNFDELPRDRGQPNTTRSAIAGLKSTCADSDEKSDDEPRDRGPDAQAATSEEAAMSYALTWLRSRPEFSSEDSQELTRIASLATRFKNERGDNSLLLPRTNSPDSTIEVELKTTVDNAAVPIGLPTIGTAALYSIVFNSTSMVESSIQEASNVSVQETSNNTFKHNVSKRTRSEQPRKQNRTTHRKSAKRPTRYKCGCGRFKTDFHVCEHTPGIGEETYQAHLDSLETPQEVSRQEDISRMESAQSDSTSSILSNTTGATRSRRPSVPRGSAEGTTRSTCNYECGKCRVLKRGHVCPYKKQKGKKKEAKK